MEDSELIAAFRTDQDSRAFEKLMERYENRVYRFGFKMCGHVQDAEDVVQDTFVSAFRYLKDFRGDSSVLTWLMKIASSACLKKRRLKKNQPKSFASFEELSERSTAGSGGGTGEGPERLTQSREVRDKLQSAISLLPQNYRVVLVLRDMEGLSVRETAEALELSESAVKVRLHRARAKLFKLYKEVDNEDTGG
jgi:RNA polymerase sigma-70 factor, ECF subfamily